MISDAQIRKLRTAVLYASRFTHEEILQRGEADEEYELQAAVAGELLGEALDILDKAVEQLDAAKGRKVK